MQLVNRFTVPAPIDDAWKALLDVPRVAPCMPGPTLDEFDGERFAGSVKVKLGPMTLVYRGQGRLTDTEEPAHRLVMEASGKETRGSGTAAATVTATMTAHGDTTQVDVTTDLKITGRPAQFGRGLINDVSEKLLQQFADCLATTLGAPSPEASARAAPVNPAEAELVGIGGRDDDGSTNDGPHREAHPRLGERGSVEDTEAEQARVEVEPIDLLEITGAQAALRRYGPYVGGAVAVLVLLWLVFRRRRD
jgi:carbon monoxide dehydrogenase subunit G